MATVPKKEKVETVTLFVRGVTAVNKRFLADNVKKQGFASQGEFLNAILDDQRKALGKRKPVAKKVTKKPTKKVVSKKKTSRGKKAA